MFKLIRGADDLHESLGGNGGADDDEISSVLPSDACPESRKW